MALEGFQKALELSPQSTDMYNPISHMLFATGRKEEACIYYYKSKALGDTTFDLNLRNHCEFE